MCTPRGPLRAIVSLRSAPAALTALVALLAGCSAGPPAPAPVVVAVPTAAPAASSAPSSEPALACPAGMAFLAGGTLRHPDREAVVADFCLDITEVTAGAYGLCVERGACNDDDLACDDAPTFKRADRVDHPINCVSWAQADSYCRAEGKRLPRAQEWEWAAQARDEGRRFAWGADEPEPDQMCWSKDKARTGTCAVGLFPGSRTPQGVDDLFGGVWEWLSPETRNGVPNVARGGCWQGDSMDLLEGTNAGAFQPGFVRNDVVGFRCASARQAEAPPAAPSK